MAQQLLSLFTEKCEFLMKTAQAGSFNVVRTLEIDETLSGPSLQHFVDGQPANLQWYLQLATGGTQVELISNCTSKVCSIPERFSQ